jgi:DNA-binding transcriptional MerR regulator
MHVAQLAKAAAVSADTVRHYTSLGLLKPTRDPQNGYQQYAATDLQRLRFVTRARRMGFSLKDIQRILSGAEHDRAPCSDVRELLNERLSALQAHIDECQRLAQVMQQAVEQWNHADQCAAEGQPLCRLIEAFETDIERRPATPCPAH